jgi:serine/threonine-protein kinase
LCPSCSGEAGEIAKFCPSCGATIVRAPQEDDLVGRIVAGKFRVEALIGEGGMGKVYRAIQLSLEKTVVLKVLRQSLLSDARTVARFQREAKAASRLNHPNSISVIDFGQGEDGSLYIAMEYVAGRDLHQLLSSEGPLGEPRMAHLLGQVLSALADAHAAGVIHRDLKPENIMVEHRRDDPDFVKVLDFGIAKIQEVDGNEGVALTRAGFVCGTPEYMSPEQARGATLDARSDLYAVGVILYQCATGALPFEADSAVALATMHLTKEPPSPRLKRADLSDAMEQLILRVMSKNPIDRPQSAEEFRAELLAAAGVPLAIRPSAPAAPSGAPSLSPLRSSPRTRGPLEERPSADRLGSSRRQEASSGVPLEPTRRSGSGSRVPEDVIAARAEATSTARPRRSLRLLAGVGLGAATLALGAAVAYRAFLGPGAGANGPVTLAAAPPPSKAANATTSTASESRAGGDPEIGEPPRKPTKDPARAREFLGQGDLAIAEGRYDDALVLYSGAYESDPAPGAAAKRLALTYLMKSDAEKATQWMRYYLSVARDAPDAPYFSRYLGGSSRSP